MPQLDYFCRKDGKDLRFGYTTGSCAAAASKAAAQMLLEGIRVSQVELMTPKGILLHLPVEEITSGEGWVSCAIRKDSGDDPDITNGILIFSRVEFSAGSGISIEGGIGVGRVTKPGLECPVGAPAINRVPREMITAAVRSMQEESGNFAGLIVTISIPEGERLAKRTFNPRLGIVGGLSVLGTSGIVEPMSEAALVDTIRVEMKQLAASGKKLLAVTPGNYGEDFMKNVLAADLSGAVKCSNFVGETLDMAGEFGFEEVLLIGHIGKFVKLAAGIMNTHSREADCRMEILASLGLLCGADGGTARSILRCALTDEAVEILDEAGIKQAVMDMAVERICGNLERRTEKMKIECMMFSNKFGELGKSREAEKWFIS